MKKNTWRYFYFTLVHHKWQSWCMVPEIWSATDNILSFWTIFCPFTAPPFPPPPPPQPNNLNQIKIFKKWKTHGHFIILNMCIIHVSVQFNNLWFVFCDSSCNFQNPYFSRKHIFYESYRVGRTQDYGHETFK